MNLNKMKSILKTRIKEGIRRGLLWPMRTHSGDIQPSALVAAVGLLVMSALTASAGTRYEAESATVAGAVISTENPGFTGTGYVDYQNASAAYIQWSVNAPSAGTYTLDFRYANGSTGDRPLELKVNGNVANSQLSFLPTGGWAVWKISSASVFLQAGTNTIRATTIGASGANIDSNEVSAKTSSASAVTGNSRGYMTTPQELVVTAQKAAQGIQPYKAARDQVLSFAGSPSYWPYGGISGPQSCSGTLSPSYIGNGAPLIFAKAMAFHLTGDSQYAAEVRSRIMDLTDTYSYGGTFSGGNQCILNLSWYIPSWIMAADLIQDYSGWSLSDKQTFQHWLAFEVYQKVDWASDRRSNNWGSAGSATAGMIADYLTGSGLLLTDRNGSQLTPGQAYSQAKQRQLDRINGNSYMDNYNCHQAVGIRPDGGISEELGRGSTGCDGSWIKDLDSSWMYTMTHLQGTMVHAELLLRRGDPSLYTNIISTGAGSVRKSILFLLHNPSDPSKSVPWKLSNDGSTLELAYRFYRDPYMAQQLGIGTGTRAICGKSGQMLHFGTITHCFGAGEVLSALPTVPPPQ